MWTLKGQGLVLYTKKGGNKDMQDAIFALGAQLAYL